MRAQHLDGIVALQLAHETRAEQPPAKLGAADRDGGEISVDRIARQLLQGRLGAQRARRPVELRVERAGHPEERTAQAPRHHAAHPLLEAMPAIAPIAGEHLVAAIARQGDGDVLARHGADPEGRDRRAVAERLVIDRRQPVEQIEGIGVDLSDVMIGPVAPGDFGGIGGFVPALRSERDREGADRLGTSAPPSSPRHRSKSTPPDRKAPSGTSAIIRMRTDSRSRAISSSAASSGRTRAAVDKAHIPVAARLRRRLAAPDEQRMRRRQLFHAAIDRSRIRDVADRRRTLRSPADRAAGRRPGSAPATSIPTRTAAGRRRAYV